MKAERIQKKDKVQVKPLVEKLAEFGIKARLVEHPNGVDGLVLELFNGNKLEYVNGIVRDN